MAGLRGNSGKKARVDASNARGGSGASGMVATAGRGARDAGRFDDRR